LDNTLTNLSGKDVAGLLAYQKKNPEAKRNVGTGDNQIPDMGPAPQVLSVNFEHISNSAWRVATSDISQQYRFSYISIGR
ncbi:hypothetical protein, partial [Salmonella enterica]|uniref:hypothetical protein n=1 Tax=Salmonella enterica TaxID=28901 RepID=UPI00070B48AC